MAIRLDDAELSALAGVTHAAFVLYVKLRTRMDYATGLVGAHKGAAISWKALCEELRVEPGPGLVNTGDYGKEAVRRLAMRLENNDPPLVVNITKKGAFRLVFRLPLATADNSASNKPDTIPTYPSRHQVDTLQATESLDSFTYTEGDPPYAGGQQPDTHPISGTKKDIQGTFVDANFKPSEEAKVRCQRAGCPVVDRDQVEAFIAHHEERATLSHNWQSLFYGWMIKAKKFSAFESVGVSRGTKKPKRPAWEFVPADDARLESWAVEHGFSKPGRVENYFAYRSRLWGEVNARKGRLEKEGAPL